MELNLCVSVSASLLVGWADARTRTPAHVFHVLFCKRHFVSIIHLRLLLFLLLIQTERFRVRKKESTKEKNIFFHLFLLILVVVCFFILCILKTAVTITPAKERRRNAFLFAKFYYMFCRYNDTHKYLTNKTNV